MTLRHIFKCQKSFNFPAFFSQNTIINWKIYRACAIWEVVSENESEMHGGEMQAKGNEMAMPLLLSRPCQQQHSHARTSLLHLQE